MEASIVGMTVVTNIADCILELVSNSLYANATSIAIRIHNAKRKIQVVDNGIGIQKVQLKEIAEYSNKDMFIYSKDISIRKKQTLTDIRKLSNAMIITSRYYNSSETYIKVFKVCHDPIICTVKRRPSQGTSVSIYGFHELSLSKWNVAFMYHLIGNIAIANPQTSFSVRDDQEKKVTMIITKPHNPIDIFKSLYKKEVLLHKIWYIKSMKKPDIKFYAYIGFSNSNFIASQCIFLNDKLVHCPIILQVASTTFINTLKFFKKRHCQQIPEKRAIFILFFIMSNKYIFTIENGKKTLMFSDMQDILQTIRKKIINIFTKNIKPLSVDVSRSWKNSSKQEFKNSNTRMIADNLIQLLTPISQNNNSNKENNQLILSEWSNWSYSVNMKQFEKNSSKFYKHFDFLPEKLHKLLRGNRKLIKTDILNEYTRNSIKLKSGLQIPDILPHQEVDVRPCKTAQRFREFKLNKELIKLIKILGQMNNELIVGLIIHNNTKMLLVMDQHAVHERIRYEHLLYGYKSQMRNQLFSIKLKDPIIIQLSENSCNLLLSYHMILKRFGITFNVIDNNTIMVCTVPECLKKNKYHYDELKLKLNVKNLLNELLQNLTSYECYEITNLPPTIHNAIAMEACHGAIKFGDPLTLKECKRLLKSLTETKIPTRCAHGRPSIIPLLELTDLKRRNTKLVQVCTTFFAYSIRVRLEIHLIKKVQVLICIFLKNFSIPFYPAK
ncbi:PREDICTED: DNA mismatch repair protein MutL-like [Eufriesea mexicana]|uniref:DNA mismatch repair protein MutL-like n=1 Tax=Eufriesea mexicana TaxID=516756 RepID=UPI00083C49C4|nr:PREDICTED: DNA mismatch repair protein MutL-like [Eufriesea mexicana]